MENRTDYKAFVSSTFTDLKDHRAHVIKALRNAGFFVDPMEEWTAAADEPREFSRQRLEGCHLCILLIARRRGHVPSGDALSITQQEYDEAKRRGIDILPYVLDDDVPESDWQPWEERDEVERWRADVFKHFVVGTFRKTPSTIDIAAALTRWVTEQGSKTALRLYLENVKQEHGVIQFVSLARLEDNSDVPILNLYVEPAVAERAVSPDDDPADWPETTPVLDALAKHHKLVLLGDPGSGKSTLTSWLAWQLAEHHEHLRSEWTQALGQLIPLPMILRDLGIGKGITWDELLEKFVNSPMGRLLTMTNLKQTLADGKAMIILDGLDEIGNPQVRSDLRNAVWRAFDEYEQCRWLLTSRIVGYGDLPFDHIRTPAFHAPIGWHNSDAYDTPVASLAYAVPFDDMRVDQFALNWFVLREQTEHKSRAQAEELLAAIRSDEATTKLGRIPNLLTMMALIYRVRARLPHGRALLYSEIAQAYLETIDFYRRIQTRTEPLADKKRWLSRIGFEMQRARTREGEAPAELHLPASGSAGASPSQSGEILATGDDVRRWTAQAMSEEGREGVEEDAAEFVDYLAKRSGLLLPRGNDQFAFLHLSFQEYFAACFLQNQIASPDWLMDDDGIAEGAREGDLRSYGGHSVWREILVCLTELVAASEQPKWLKPIFKCLFGPGFDGIEVGSDDAAQSRTLLLARLAIDPHAGFSADDRALAIKVCCAREVQLMNNDNDADRFFHSNEVLRVLLGVEAGERKAILNILCDQASELNATRLDLSGTGVSDVSSLSDLLSLQELNLHGTGVSDVSSLSSLSSLQSLYLSWTGVSDVSSLSGLSSLQYLHLGENGVSDVSSLSGLSSLQSLHLDGTCVSDVSSLSGLSSLQFLYLSGTGVSDEQIAEFHAERSEAGLPECRVHK